MQRNEHAVSPVVGVMLMLVVTIIIAAVVSAFAGSTVSGTDKAPQATVQATYSLTNGMSITHTGGDAIPMSTTTIMVTPGRSFGDDASRYSWVVNKSRVLTNSGTWATVRAFMPGETARITAKNLTYIQQRPDLSLGDDMDASYGFNNTGNLGLTFELQFQDSSGKIIAQTPVMITG
ncbi:MAG: type IV pilin N-terminal domain-containing protein [Methanoregula sp.]|jgi:FlaG/FlaF family flagellin (archaellin)